VHAGLVRGLATTPGGTQWRFAITDEHGQLSHCGITAARPTGAPGRMAACRATVELQVSAACLAAFDERPNGLSSWADVVADVIRQWKVARRTTPATSTGGPPGLRCAATCKRAIGPAS